MKQVYLKPVLRIIKIQQVLMQSGSWDKMGPGEPNQPAGSRFWEGGLAEWNPWDDVDVDIDVIEE